MCQNYITMFGGTEDFRSEQGSIVQVARVMDVVSKVAPFITSESLLCVLLKQKTKTKKERKKGKESEEKKDDDED